MFQPRNIKLALALSLMFTVTAPAVAAEAKPGEKVSTLPDVYTVKKTPSVKVDPELVQRPPASMPPLPQVNTVSVQQSKDEAFQSLIDSEMPMTPGQIIKIRKLLDEQQKAKATLPYIPPKPVVSTMIVKGDPGETPPVLRLSKNFVSTLVFSDLTGAPWPITSFGAGNDDMFSVANPDPKSAPNVLTISTGSAYAYGNIQVALAGRPSPIMITLVADQKYVDYQANVSVQARGPNAVSPTAVAGSTFQTNPTMVSFLDGIPPEKATPLDVADPRVQGWKLNDKYYIRTKMTLYSPAWSNHHASPDGMHAYEITPTPVIVSGENGNPQPIRIGE